MTSLLDMERAENFVYAVGTARRPIPITENWLAAKADIPLVDARAILHRLTVEKLLVPYAANGARTLDLAEAHLYGFNQSAIEARLAERTGGRR